MITIRKASLKDVRLLMDMWKEFMKLHDSIVLKKNIRLKSYIELKKDAHKRFGKYIKKNIRSQNGLILIAEVDGKPAGYAFSLIKKNITVFKLEKIGYLSDMYVKKKYRGSGISTRLKDDTIIWLRKKSIKHIYLKVFSDNEHARKVYKKWGFFDHSIEMYRKI